MLVSNAYKKIGNHRMEGSKGPECYLLSIATLFSDFTTYTAGQTQDHEGWTEPVTLIMKVMNMDFVLLFVA